MEEATRSAELIRKVLPGHSPGHTSPAYTLSCTHFAFMDTLLDKLESGMEEATRSAELIRKVRRPRHLPRHSPGHTLPS